jgi:hypothetical protein
MNINEILDKIKWGGSGIERETIEFIITHIPLKSKVLELGSGFCSTRVLSMLYDLHTVEENHTFVNQHKEAKYIHAPIHKNWYNREILKNEIPKDYVFAFIDGPAGEEKRLGMLENLDIFNPNATYMVHDTYRKCDKTLAEELGKKLNKQVKFFSNKDHFAYIS